MAFTLEDGSVVTDANAYISVSYADTFHSDRGNTDWTGTDAVKEAAIIKATDYIDQNYDFIGTLVDVEQSLKWPRYGFEQPDSDEVPKQIMQATAILALEALSSDLSPNLERGGAVKREKVDVIEVEYMDGAPSRTSRPAITGLMRGLTKGTAITAVTVRV